MTEDCLDIEHASLRAWPALESEVLDGWELRFARGFTKRANSVQPFARSDLPLAEKVAHCERWYGERGAPATFRLTPWADPELDRLLERRGYERVDLTAVLHRSVRTPTLPESRFALRSLDVGMWLAMYDSMTPVANGTLPTMRSVLDALQRGRLLGGLWAGDGPNGVACGMAVADGGLVGLFNLVTDPEHRRKGFGSQMVASLLRWGEEQGAERAYLQVTRSNGAAWGLYQKLGFGVAYEYWYRIRRT